MKKKYLAIAALSMALAAGERYDIICCGIRSHLSGNKVSVGFRRLLYQ